MISVYFLLDFSYNRLCLFYLLMQSVARKNEQKLLYLFVIIIYYD